MKYGAYITVGGRGLVRYRFQPHCFVQHVAYEGRLFVEDPRTRIISAL